MIELKEWIKDGIDIRKTNEGYVVFTIPTQHFNIKELDELTPERFSKEVERQDKANELTSELLGNKFNRFYVLDSLRIRNYGMAYNYCK